jgi:hypothetical protein
MRLFCFESLPGVPGLDPALDPGAGLEPALDLGWNPPEDVGLLLLPLALWGRGGLFAVSARSWFTVTKEGGGRRGASWSTAGAREERLCAEAECLITRPGLRPPPSTELWLGECFCRFGELEADEERGERASFAEPMDRRDEIRFPVLD